MKQYIIKIALFFAILFVVDRVAGYIFSYMSNNCKGGYVGHHNYILKGLHEDILIFGSSRAIHHYNPQIIADSLGMSCYNCGQDGNGIILFYGWWQVIKQHHKPKVIIYDITPFYDLYKGKDNQKYLGWLKEVYDEPNISGIFDDVDASEKYKMESQLYRYNSKFHQIAADFIHPILEVKANGFLPLQGNVDTMRIKKDKGDEDMKDLLVDSLKIKYLNTLIDETDGVRLFFTVSPMWYGIPSQQLSPIRKICNQHNIPFLDFSNSPKYVHINKYFKDGSHLNSLGADEYSRDLMILIKQQMTNLH